MVLKGRGKVLTTPPYLGGLDKHELVAAFGGTEGLKAGKSSREGGPLGEDGIVVHSCFGAEDRAKERGGREAKGEEKEAKDVLIREVRGEAVESDTSGGTMERMVEGDMRSVELVGDSGEGGGESREEGRFKVGLAGAKDKTQVGAEPLTE
jgi:hypothetical protein